MMFTVEDVNSVLLVDRCNGYHCIDTSLRGSLDYVLLDFVKVKKTGTGFSFSVDNSLWCGGFYLTTTAGEYISLSSGDYSYSGGLLSVTTNETDVVLVLYCSSFYDLFSVQYLNCRLESLSSVVDLVSVTVDDFSSLDGTPISSGDISVSDSVVTCRNNSFYKDIVVLPELPVITVGSDGLVAGSPVQTVELVSSEDINGVTVEYGNVKEYVEFTESEGSFNVDLREHLTATPFNFRVLFKGIVFELSVPVSIIEVTSPNSLKQAIDSKIRIIRMIRDFQAGDSVLVYEIDYDLTLLSNNYRCFGVFKIKEGVTFVADNLTFKDRDYNFDIGENTNVTFKNCQFRTGRSNETIIFANEDLEDTNSKILIDSCRFYDCDAPAILFDGELEIRDSLFLIPRIPENTSIMEPCFIHMTAGKLTIHNTRFDTATDTIERVISLEGYNLATILLGEDTTLNGTPALEVTKGNPSLQQYGITSTMNVNYQNGGETVHLTDGFYIAVEDKKIKNIKED